MSSSKRVISYRQRTKQRAIVYKGGSCIVCLYSKCIRSLQFHHLDPKEKDRRIGSGNTIAWKRLKIELDKCVLLCANCHGELHDGLLDITPYLKRNPTPEQGVLYIEETGLNLQSKTQEKSYCRSCNIPIYKGSQKCKKCENSSRVGNTKIEWPPLAQLLHMIRETSYTAVGRELGVSGNAVKKHVKTRSAN